MKSKGFKIVVGVLVAVIVVLGGLIVAKNLNAGESGDATAQGGREIPAGAVADDPSLPLPPDGATETLTPGDEAAN